MIAKSISSAGSSITSLLALGVLAFAAVGWSQEASPPAANQASQTTTEKREETLRAEHQVVPDPGTLVDYRQRVGMTFCFQITGRLQNQTNSAVEAEDGRGTTDLSLEPYPYRMVWGDGIYTDDSPLALTAVQAGLLNPGETGICCVVVLSGFDHYNAANRHGVQSSEYGPWQGSYVFVSKRPMPVAAASQTGAPATLEQLQKRKSDLEFALRQASQSFAPDDPTIVALRQEIERTDAQIQSLQQTSQSGSNGQVLPDPGTLTAYHDKVGKQFCFDVTGSDSGNIWGSGIYTDDSSLAVAAVHAGILKAGQHGRVCVMIAPGQAWYDGATHNGVTSMPYQSWQGSYVFVNPAAGTDQLSEPVRESTNLGSVRYSESVRESTNR